MVDKTACEGCRDDFYNHNDMGANVVNGELSCWLRAEAKMVSARDVPRDLPPPYLGIREKRRPNCWRGAGIARVLKTALDVRGYWK